jgi:hypothetical protein
MRFQNNFRKCSNYLKCGIGFPCKNPVQVGDPVYGGIPKVKGWNRKVEEPTNSSIFSLENSQQLWEYLKKRSARK